MGRIGFLFLFITLTLASCFNVREPEKPTTNSDFVFPSEPSLVLSNLSTAFLRMNTENYIRCFKEESFRFFPAQQVNANPSVFAGWGLRKEERDVLINLNNVLIPDGDKSVTLILLQSNFLNADSLETVIDYRLSFQTTDTSFNSSDIRGQAQMIMVRNASTNEWRITRWADNRTNPDFRCWTELKLRYVTR